MKTNKFFAFAALACGFAMSFTSCNNEDNPIGGLQVYTISFENQTLNDDGFWCGDETGEKYESWGADAYACKYSENGASFVANYIPSWAYWSGFAISNRTDTSFNSKTMTPDQFNNITGKAHSGNNFCVVYPYGEAIEVNGGKPAFVNGFWFTNEAWTVSAILNGDGMSKVPGGFDKTDWFKCTVTGKKQGGGTVSVDIDLAKDGDYVKEWKYCDLSSMGKVVELSFSFTGSKYNDGGVTTPTYMCIDDIEIEK
jgi:hypothetical protein